MMHRLSPTLKTLLEGLAYADLAEWPPSAGSRSLGPCDQRVFRLPQGAMPAKQQARCW
jgi:hypothetical protein